MKTVVIGMSGGVDSSVSAYLLKKQGYNVIGLFMKNWEEVDEDGFCTAEEDYDDARAVCLKLDIPCYTVNFTKEYWDNVFTYFLEEYKKGFTPNPDVLCNKEIKFKYFLDYALNTFNADYIATGHYARTLKDDNNNVHLLKGIDESKDQSYFLCMLSQKQLENVIFPIGEIEKKEVRRIAEELQLRTAHKKDSTGICFIGERNFTDFLKNYLPANKGDMIDLDTGKKVGEHMGLMYYTLGQRRGLGIGGGGNGKRWYVTNKDLENNILYVVQGEDHESLFSIGFIGKSPSFVLGKAPSNTFDCEMRFRHLQKLHEATVTIVDDDTLKVIFKNPMSSVTPGQVAAFYQGDICLGGSEIYRLIKN